MTFYTVHELEEMLKLSKSQLYALIDDGQLRCHRFTRGRNGAIRVSQAQLDEYLKTTEDTREPAVAAPAARPTPATSCPKGHFEFLPPRS
jgi:excisionase family DNA binding protein